MLEELEYKRPKFQDILRKMPLRAEYLTAEAIAELRILFQHSYIERYAYDYYFDSDGKKHICDKWIDHFNFDPLTDNYRSLVDFFITKDLSKRYIMGLKGVGKTFTVLLALNKAIEMNAINEQNRDELLGYLSRNSTPVDTRYEKIKPCYISFDSITNKIYVKNPLSYATKEQWLAGGVEPPHFLSFEENIEWANLIIFDEIHYFLEYVIDNNLPIYPFTELLTKIMKRNCKILLLSEEMMFHYAEKINDKSLDEVCIKFGLLPKFDMFDPCMTAQHYHDDELFDFLAFKEIRPPQFYDLIKIDAIYGFDIPIIVLQFLASVNCTIRALIKLLKALNYKITLESFANFLSNHEVANTLECLPMLKTLSQIEGSSIGKILEMIRGNYKFEKIEDQAQKFVSGTQEFLVYYLRDRKIQVKILT